MKISKISFISMFAFGALFFVHPDYSESEEINSSHSFNTVLFANSLVPEKTIIRAVESIVIHSNSGYRTVKARIDTGATQSSIDMSLARQLGYNKYVGRVNVVSANGIKTRPVVEISYELSGKRIISTFTLADRSNLNYSVLIGRNDLNGFLIDPTD
ncbi:MAG: ATP-dependent zinc protease [Candidatus Sericytochromatia bacterium]|nr:ATP-dependent zinc protease [Candidatus Sericytochromatia bacterium]